MSGSVTRAYGWQTNGEEQYLAASPSGDVFSLYQTVSDAKNEDDNIAKINEISGFDSIKCIQYSSTVKGLVSVGQLNGKCFLFDISKDSKPTVMINPPQSRSCNSMSFNEEGILALGYERARQENSIQIYDVSHLQSSNGAALPICNYVQNESVTSLSFCPTETKNFVAGSYKLLREFDIRSPTPVYQLATRCTMNITVDPYDQYIFASTADDGSLALWDRRKLNDSSILNNVQLHPTAVLNETPILQFNKLLTDSQRRTNGLPYRFSTVRRGELSALFDGELVKRWQICSVPPSRDEMDQYEESSNLNKSDPTLKNNKPYNTLFVSNVSDVKTKYERVISYDYAPSPKLECGIDLVCMRQSGNLYKMSVSETQKVVKFNVYNDIAFSGAHGTLMKIVDDVEIPIDSSNSKNKLIKKMSKVEISNSFNEEEDNDSDIDQKSDNIEFYGDDLNNARLTTSAVLENDICTTMRRRATLGYGTNSENNMNILDKLQTFETQSLLKNAWKWIDISHELISSGRMSYGDFDFGYLGVLGIWNLENYYHNFSRYSGFRNITERDILNAAKRIIERRSNEVLLSHPVYSKGKKEVQRRLAMYVIGWDFGISELEEKYESLTKRGNYERAAGWAIFHNDINRAVKILAESDIEKYKIMSTAIAAYHAFSKTEVNNVWKEQCRELGGELDDPYLRAIFAFVADGNWWDVLDETALPLRERLGVALRFLPDGDLDVFLNRIAELVIERGEIEGIILTGITKRGVDLLQSFVDRSSDVQSASLIATFACPKYFDDERVDNWVDNYRSLLNSWNLFSVRARYDVARSKLANFGNGNGIFNKSNHKQLDIQCTNCHKSIYDENNSNGRLMSNSTTNIPSIKKMKTTSCQNCGFPLPRCAICLLTQGEPVPMHLLTIDNTKPLKNETNAGLVRKFKQWFSYCLSCNHSMHVGHAEEWFSKHFVCPVPECECKCNQC